MGRGGEWEGWEREGREGKGKIARETGRLRGKDENLDYKSDRNGREVEGECMGNVGKAWGREKNKNLELYTPLKLKVYKN